MSSSVLTPSPFVLPAPVALENQPRYKLSIVSITRGSPDDLRFLENQIQTCSLFLDLNEVESWWLVVPGAKVSFFENYLERLCQARQWCAPWIVYSEDLLLSWSLFGLTLDRQRYHKFLKLAISRIVLTKSYLVLDSDVLCIRPTKVAELFLEGRSKATVVKKAQKGFSYTFDRWKPTSEAALYLGNISVPFIMDVTPQILNRDIVNQMDAHLRQHGSRLEDLLFSWRRWTEYTAYFLIAYQYGLWEKYHAQVPQEEWLAPSVWYREESSRWNVEKIFSHAKRIDTNSSSTAFFVVFQSNTHISGTYVRDQIQKYLPSKPHFPYRRRS